MLRKHRIQTLPSKQLLSDKGDEKKTFSHLVASAYVFCGDGPGSQIISSTTSSPLGFCL